MQEAIKNIKKPEWVPAEGNPAFATQVLDGVEVPTPPTKIIERAAIPQKKELTIKEIVEGIRSNNRTVLARAITIIESNSAAHQEKAQNILQQILPFAGNSLRIGITGAPGAGKSTFIDSLGNMLCEMGHNVAVLAIDPSSSRSHGSILGDKTRMERLSQQKNAFIRPSPSGGTLGGVARKTRESIMLCEAAGFDVIIIETIGVGQSEITVRSMVDFLLLLLLPSGGDELQGIKKGSVELADCIAINKADGDLKMKAMATQQDYRQAVHYIMPATEGWTTPVLTCAALNDSGISEIWNEAIAFQNNTKKSGQFSERRQQQQLDWTFSLVEEALKTMFYSNKKILNLLPQIKNDIINSQITPSNAVQLLLNTYFSAL